MATTNYTPSSTRYADTSAARLLLELERHLADVPDRYRCGCDLCIAYGVICYTVGRIDQRRQAATARVESVDVPCEYCNDGADWRACTHR